MFTSWLSDTRTCTDRPPTEEKAQRKEQRVKNVNRGSAGRGQGRLSAVTEPPLRIPTTTITGQFVHLSRVFTYTYVYIIHVCLHQSLVFSYLSARGTCHVCLHTRVFTLYTCVYICHVCLHALVHVVHVTCVNIHVCLHYTRVFTSVTCVYIP